MNHQSAFADLIVKYTKAGTLLRGLRVREGLTQEQFAEIIEVTQANLSSMENGKRPIGKSKAMLIDRFSLQSIILSRLSTQAFMSFFHSCAWKTHILSMQ